MTFALDIAAFAPPITGNAALWSAILAGGVFGMLLHKGGVTNYNVIVNQFRFKDFTVLKIMLTAIVVGAIGVFFLVGADMAKYHIKSADMLPVIIGSALFGVGMVLYGYCPGTGVAAVATGSIHALVGMAGMLTGGILYAVAFPWVQANLEGKWDLGKARLSTVTPIPDIVWIAALAVIAGVVFVLLAKLRKTPDAS